MRVSKRSALWLLTGSIVSTLFIITLLSCGGSPSFAAIRTSAVKVTIVPNQATVDSGASLQFNAQVVGAANSAVSWTAVLGSVSPSGLYTAPKVEGSTIDTVSAISVADPNKYVTVEITVASGESSSHNGGSNTNNSGSSSTSAQSQQIYTLASQQPNTLVPYANNPGSITSKRLPSNVMSHLFRGSSGISSSDAVAKCSLTDCGADSPSNWGAMDFALPGSNDRGVPVYYGQASDPWYKLSGCNTTFLNGLTFHAPSGAKYSQSGDDEALAVWDQSSQMMIAMGTGVGGRLALPPSSCPGSGSSACAVPTNSPRYCMAEKFNQERDWGWAGTTAPVGGGNSMSTGTGLSAFAGVVRYRELMQGHIYHALRLLDDCNNTATLLVFPDTISEGSGLPCNSSIAGTNSPSRPAAGMLFFLDYSDAQLSCLNPATAPCSGITKLPAWQYPFIEAFSHYGGYLGVTTGGPQVTGGITSGLSVGANSVESPEAYAYTRVGNSFFTWLSAQPGVQFLASSTGSNRYRVRILANIPLMPGPGGGDTSGRSCRIGSGCDVSGHAHIADPCVARALAGQTTAQGACF